MSKAKGFNGYPNWTQWNVSLWINNDEGLYRLAQECIQAADTRENAAKRMMWDMQGEQTPDGAKYSVTAIRRAMVGM